MTPFQLRRLLAVDRSPLLPARFDRPAQDVYTAKAIDNDDNPQFVFKRPHNEAGGFVTGFDIASNGTDMLCWTDVFNAYLRRAGSDHWTLLFNKDTLDRDEYDPRPKREHGGWGSFAARFAPSDPNRIYANWNGALYRFDNGKAVRTVLPPKQFRIDGANRRFNHTIAVHAENRDLVLVGTQGDGCYVSADGFTKEFVQLDLPATGKEWTGLPGKYLVAFHGDEAFVHVFGVGLYHYPDGPFGKAVFAGRPGDGEPLNASYMHVTPAGDVWICRYRTANIPKNDQPQFVAAQGLWRWRKGTWRQFAQFTGADQVAIDPYDERRIVCTDENSGKWWISLDGGETVTSYGNEFRGSGEVGWLSNRKKAMYPSKIGFHPVERSTLVISDGVGITAARMPKPGEELTVHDFSRGIHELVSTCGISRAGQSDVIIGCMDKPVWRVAPDMGLTGEWSYCDASGKPNPSAVAHIRSIDDAIDDPNFLAGIFHQSGGTPGWSDDWGTTWKPFGLRPDGKPWLLGGCIAVSNRSTMLMAEGNNGGLWRTADGGATWSAVGFGGVDQVTHLINAYYVHRKCIAADKTRPGTFAVLINTFKQPGSDILLGGVWLTKDGGLTFERTFDGAVHAPGQRDFEPSQFWQCRMEYVPGHPGELVYANCTEGRKGDKMMWSRDDGASWREFPVSRTTAFAFGKGRGDRPAIWFYGFVGNTRGWYVTFDWFESDPVLISRFPGGVIDQVGRGLSMVGDMNRAGRAAIGFGGNNWLFCEPAQGA